MSHGRRQGRDDALAERRERLLEQQAALASLTKSPVFHGDDLEEAIRHVTGMAARLMRIERVSLWRYTEARTAIRCIDLYERGQDRHSAGAEIDAELHPAYFEALATSEAIVADDAHTDPRTCELSRAYPISRPSGSPRNAGDLPALVGHFVRRFAERYGKPLETVSPVLMAALEEHDWPGNVRKLEHVIERAVILSRGAELTFDKALSVPIKEGDPEPETMAEAERAHILRVLEAARWRVAGPNGAAERLGLRPTTLESRMKKLGIRRPG